MSTTKNDKLKNYFKPENLKNIGIIEKIRIENESMYIQIKLDSNKGDDNIFFLDKDDCILLPTNEELKVDENLYTICQDAKIHRLKCAFEVAKGHSKILEKALQAIDEALEVISEETKESLNAAKSTLDSMIKSYDSTNNTDDSILKITAITLL